MLTTLRQPLKPEELSALRAWLASDGARIFRDVLDDQVKEAQIEATKHFADDARPQMEANGRELLSASLKYRQTLRVLKEFADIKTKPYRVKIVED